MLLVKYPDCRPRQIWAEEGWGWGETRAFKKDLPLGTPLLIARVRTEIRYHHDDALSARTTCSLTTWRRSGGGEFVAFPAPGAAPCPAAKEGGGASRGVEAIPSNLSCRVSSQSDNVTRRVHRKSRGGGHKVKG